MKFVILFALSLSITQTALAITCSQIISNQENDFVVALKSSGNGVVLKDSRIAVTGDRHYPLDFVLDNMKITDELSSKWAEQKQSVLSIAEGESGLLPHLKSKNVQIKGLDLWYSEKTQLPKNIMGRRMFRYRKQNAENLIAGSVFDMPISSSSVDVVISHFLVNNISEEQISKVFTEVLRVLKVGGKARIFPFEYYFNQLHKFLKLNFPEQVDGLKMEDDLLIFTKQTESNLDVEIKQPNSTVYSLPPLFGDLK